jgi:hypothetical protein
MNTLEITWADKEDGGEPQIDRKKQWWYQDANEVKNTVNNHKTLLDQFTFSDPLDGKVGLGVTPTAKIHAKASTAGEPLFKLETFGGATTLQADDNGSVWNSGVSGTNQIVIGYNSSR